MRGKGHQDPASGTVTRRAPVPLRPFLSGSGMCMSCVLFLRVHECMLWGHRAYSNKSALRLRQFRRSDELRAL